MWQRKNSKSSHLKTRNQRMTCFFCLKNSWKVQLQTNFLSVTNWALDLFDIFVSFLLGLNKRLAEKCETNKCCKGIDLPSLLIYFQSVGIPPVERLLVPPVLLTLATGPGSAPHSTEVMCLPWHCPTAPGEQWLRAGITSGLGPWARLPG